MATAIIKLIDAAYMAEFYFSNDNQKLARQLLGEGRYTAADEIITPGSGEDAAEEMFDLTNNPYRQEEREMLYGRGRSVSVGDIVEVDGANYLCDSAGWSFLG